MNQIETLTPEAKMALYTVSFVSLDGQQVVSRFFSTIRAARKWAKMLASKPYASGVKIYRGQVGECLVETAA